MSKNGFLYTNDLDRAKEFAAAEYLFNKYPALTKISRKLWCKYAHELNTEPNEQQEWMKTFSLPKHSYFKQADGLIVAFARGKNRGGLLGEGGFGRVKYAMDKEGQLYAMKVEKSKPKQLSKNLETEAKISREVGLMIGDPTTITKPDDSSKHYSLQKYLGIPLQKKLESENLTYRQKLIIAKKIAWEVHKLHAGYASSSGEKYAHHDLKPDNIVLDENNNPKLIDYGLSGALSDETPLRGTLHYMPYIHSKELKREERLKRLQKIFRQISCAEKDNFALKRVFYMGDLRQRIPDNDLDLFSDYEFSKFPKQLQDSLDTQDISTAILRRRNDSPLNFALCFLALEHQNNLASVLSYTPTHQEKLYQTIEILEFLQEKNPAANIDWQALCTQIFSIDEESEITSLYDELVNCKTNSEDNFVSACSHHERLNRMIFLSHPSIAFAMNVYQDLQQIKESYSGNKTACESFLFAIHENILNSYDPNILEQMPIAEMLNNLNLIQLLNNRQQKAHRDYIMKYDIPNMNLWRSLNSKSFLAERWPFFKQENKQTNKTDVEESKDSLAYSSKTGSSRSDFISQYNARLFSSPFNNLNEINKEENNDASSKASASDGPST